jgi:hypothetical protein
MHSQLLRLFELFEKASGIIDNSIISSIGKIGKVSLNRGNNKINMILFNFLE